LIAAFGRVIKELKYAVGIKTNESVSLRINAESLELTYRPKTIENSSGFNYCYIWCKVYS